MKLFLDIRSVSRTAIPLATAALLASSCNLMHDDLPACAVQPETRVAVNFRYDYNTADEDQFADNVGSVTLYIFDDQDHFIRAVEHTATANDLKNPQYQMTLDLPVGTYHLYASARESADGYEAAMLTPGAKFRRSAVNTGDPATSLLYTLDHTAGTVANEQLPLEQFWLTRQMTELTVIEAPVPAEGDPQPDDVTITATVPLQRVTNNLHITVTRGVTDATAHLPALKADDYEIWVETRTGRHELDLLGRPTAAARPLKYIPHAYTTTASRAAGAPSLTAEIATSRLIHEADPNDRTHLMIHSRLSGDTFAFDLTELLSRGRTAAAIADKGWSEQEFLDREYDYNLAVEFNEADDGWRYIKVSVAVLDWSIVIQNVDF